MKTSLTALWLLAVVGIGGVAKAATLNVDCSANETLRRALVQASPGDRILVQGVCRERITISKDHITVRGVNGAVIDGGGTLGSELPPFGEVGVVKVDGAQGVNLRGLRIINGPSDGILVRNGGAISGHNLSIRDNSSHGILVIGNSFAELSNVSILRSGTIGLYVLNGSSAVLERRIRVRESGQNGIAIDTASSVEARGADVMSTNNAQDGFSIESESAWRILGAPESEGTMLIAENNGRAGLFLGQSTLTITGGGPFAGNFTVNLSNNGTFGMLVPLGGAVISPRASARFIIENNPAAGMLFQGGSSALIVGGLSVQNNGVGLIADGADDIALIGDEGNPSSIENNVNVDVNYSFGTHSTINGVAVGAIACDDTVLSRGSVVCP